MKAITISAPGGPDVLTITELPDPAPASGEILIRVKAFGLNHAETYMRNGSWGQVARVPGIECAGIVEADPSALRDSLRIVRRRGRVCQLGFLGGLDPVPDFNPIADLPSGVQFSFYGSAFVLGTRDFPLSEIPLADMIAKAESGSYRAKPVRVFRFSEIVEAHRAMEAGQAAGKMVVAVD